VQGSSSARRSAGDTRSYDDNEDDSDDDRTPLRLHEGRQCQQGRLQGGRRTNAHRSFPGRCEDDHENDVHYDGLHQVVQ
jgi:hypothetical protein